MSGRSRTFGSSILASLAWPRPYPKFRVSDFYEDREASTRARLPNGGVVSRGKRSLLPHPISEDYISG